jgi:uncharacterized protein (DUF1015 family)
VAVIKPFKALRPDASQAKQVSCVPYDVVYESEVRKFIEENPLSFLRVTRAEAEFAEGSDPAPDKVFARAKANLDDFVARGIYSIDDQDVIYIYRLSSKGHTQTGVVACCSLDEYENSDIRKHEKVRPDKVEDRLRHLLAVEAQTGLIFLACRNTVTLHKLVSGAVLDEPIYDFECAGEIRHTVWRIAETAPWINAFMEVPRLYIADGHHRAESALQARDMLRQGRPQDSVADYDYVVAGIFPAEDLRILPYNRVVKDFAGLSEDEFLARLAENFIVTDTTEKKPESHGEICMYTKGKWRHLRFAVQYFRQPDPIEALDVSILQNFVLDPVLGIKDPRTDDRIGFVGGARGTAELERLVDEGVAVAAFSLYPTTMDDLFAVSDMGEIMPPKSTWFEPKLKDGLLVHMI